MFLLPVRRTKNGRSRQLGLTLQELAPCRLELPLLTGPHGEPAAPGRSGIAVWRYTVLLVVS